MIKRLIRLAEDYSYDTLINSADNEFINKINNPAAFTGAISSFDSNQQKEIADKIVNLKDKINIDNQKDAFKTLFDKLNITDKFDIQDNNADVVVKISDWAHKNNNTTLGEFTTFIKSLNIEKKEIESQITSAMQSNKINDKIGKVLLDNLSKVNF